MEIRLEAKLLFKQAQRKAVNMLSLFSPPHLSLQHTYSAYTFSQAHTTGGCEVTWERKRCMIRIAMNAQNGKTGAAGRQVSGLRGRTAEVQGYVAACLMRALCSRSLGVTKVRPRVLQLIITPLSVWVDACVCVFLIFIILVGFYCYNP